MRARILPSLVATAAGLALVAGSPTGCRCEEDLTEIKCDFEVDPSGDGAPIEFRETAVDDERVRSFTITNTGNVALSTFSAPFDERNAQHYRVDIPEGFQVNPGAEGTLTVVFHPVAESPELNASFRIEHAPVSEVACPVVRVFLRGSSFEREDPVDGGPGPSDGGPDGGPDFGDGGVRDAGPVQLPDGGIVVDPNSRFVAYGAFEEARAGFAAVKLEDGTVLAVGGYGENGQALTSIERFDPTTGATSVVGNMAVARAEPGAARLSDGRVLIAGGRSEAVGGFGVTTIEIFDPASGQVLCPPQPGASTCSLEDIDQGRGLLPEGRVDPLVVSSGLNQAVVFGGRVVDDATGAETPAAGGWVVTVGAGLTRADLTGAVPSPREGEVRVVAEDGSFLIAGGRSGASVLSDVFVFDAALDQIQSTSIALTTPRAFADAALREDGSVVVAGGINAFGGPHAKMEVVQDAFGPSPQVVEVAGLTLAPRVRPTVAALPGGIVLYAGGLPQATDGLETDESVVPLAGADVFVPFGASSFVRLSPDNDLAVPRAFHEALVVETDPDAGVVGDEVLFLGGSNTAPRRTPHPHAERYALADNLFDVYGLMGPGTAFEAGVLVSPGAALFSAGGIDPHTGSVSDVVRAFDSIERRYDKGPPLGSPRRDHTLTRLADDTNYLVVGGRDPTGQVLQSASIYNPLVGVDVPLPFGMVRPRAEHTATRLEDGTVLLCGGVGTGGEALDTCEVFTPPDDLNDPATYATAEFGLVVGRMSTGRVGHTATLLDTGEVLLVGGGDVETDQVAADLFDQAQGRVQPTGVPNRARRLHAAVGLGGGRVLIVGGEVFVGGLAPTAEVELYERQNGIFIPVGSMEEARVGPGAYLLADGNVLVTGGAQVDTGEFPTRALKRSELYVHDGTGVGAFEDVDVPLSYARAGLVPVDVFGRAVAASGTHRDGRLGDGAERRSPVLFVDQLEGPDEAP